MMLSVRLQCYNHGLFIEKALHSIICQKTSFPFEVVIGDDFSTDDTLSVIESVINKNTNSQITFHVLDRPIGGSYWKDRQDIGRLHNFTNIIDNCQGKYIALLDGDDYWTDPLKLQKQVDFLETHLDYSLCFHKVQILKPNKQLVEDYITNVPNDSETISTLVQHGNYIHTPSVVFRNCIADLPFGFTEAPFGDFFLYFILAHHGKLKYIDEDMAVYRSDIGLISNMTERIMSANYVKLYSCMISFTTDASLKKIIMDKQQEILRSYNVQFDNKYWELKNELKLAFVSHNKLFKGLKYLQSKYWKLKQRKKDI